MTSLLSALKSAPRVSATAGKIQLVQKFSVFTFKNTEKDTTSHFVRGTDPENSLPVDCIINEVPFESADYVALVKVAQTKTGGMKCASVMKLTKEEFTEIMESQAPAQAPTDII